MSTYRFSFEGFRIGATMHKSIPATSIIMENRIQGDIF